MTLCDNTNGNNYNCHISDPYPKLHKEGPNGCHYLYAMKSIKEELRGFAVKGHEGFSCSDSFDTSTSPDSRFTIGLLSKSLQECAARTLITLECKNGSGQGLFVYEGNKCHCCTSVTKKPPTQSTFLVYKNGDTIYSAQPTNLIKIVRKGRKCREFQSIKTTDSFAVPWDDVLQLVESTEECSGGRGHFHYSEGLLSCCTNGMEASSNVENTEGTLYQIK